MPAGFDLTNLPAHGFNLFLVFVYRLSFESWHRNFVLQLSSFELVIVMVTHGRHI